MLPTSVPVHPGRKTAVVCAAGYIPAVLLVLIRLGWSMMTEQDGDGSPQPMGKLNPNFQECTRFL